MEHFLVNSNSSLFKDIVLPVSDLLDKSTLVDNILLECGEFETLYADPEFQKFATETFFKTHYRTIKKWVDALAIQYEPLENYNRTEVEKYNDENNIAEIHTTVDGLRKTTEVEGKTTETQYQGEVTTKTVEGKTTTETVEGKTTEESHKGKETTTVDPPDTSDVKEYSQPYNSGQTEPTTTTLFDKQTKTLITDSVTGNNQTVTVVEGDATDPDTRTIQGDVNYPGTTTVQGDANYPGTTTVQGNSNDPSTITKEGDQNKPHTIETGHEPNEKDTNTIVRNPRELHAFGNIGVTTSQQMLQSELDIALFNIYKKITNMYMCELTIPVYE